MAVKEDAAGWARYRRRAARVRAVCQKHADELKSGQETNWREFVLDHQDRLAYCWQPKVSLGSLFFMLKVKS